VISDAGARNTFLRLVPEDVPLPFRSALRDAPAGLATVVLYLGLSRSPATLGVRGENFWLHDDVDHDALWARRGRVVDGEVGLAYLSFPSMKDPLARAHTAEIVTGGDAADFAPWAGARWRRRGQGYEALKERMADAMLRVAEKRVPGLRDLVVYREVSTPLTTEHFTAHPGGEIYGIPFTPARLRMSFLRSRTPIPGVFLAGADAAGPGIMGATTGGLLAAAAAAGPSIFRAVRARARALRERAASATASATCASIA
jgi:all-trans-retinol 13,14-reductase